MIKKILNRAERYLINIIKLIKGEIKWVHICRNWYLMYYLYLCKKRKPFDAIFYIKGLNVICSSMYGDKEVLREAFLYDYYVNSHVDISKVKTIIDLGAHNGYEALIYTDLNDECRVISVEPNERNYKIFKQNIRNNKKEKQIKLLKTAIWSEKKRMSFFTSSTYSAGHSLVNTHLTDLNESETVVDCITIEELLENNSISNIDLFKVDIEGAEYEVFFNMDRKILKNTKCILMECHPHNKYSADDMVEYLSKLGFTIDYPYKYETFIIAKNGRYL